MIQLNPTARLKTAMAEALKKLPFKRSGVVTRMNDLAAAEGITCNGRKQVVTEHILDKWLAQSRPEYVIPLRYLPIFCHVTESLSALEALADCLGARVIDAKEARIVDWVRSEENLRELARETNRLRQEAGL